MNELVLYDKYGVALFTIDLDESSTHDWSLMGENKLSISFEREKCTVLKSGCYVEFDGMRYYLLDEYKPRMINSVTWKYDVAFLDAASWMSVVLAMNTIDGKKLPIFNYTGPAREHAEIIVANLNRYMGTAEWKVGAVIDTPNIYIEYRGKYCAQILQEIVDREDTEWWVDGMTLNIGRAEFGDAVELGYRKGLLGDISREQAADKRAYAYLVPIGSTRNIDPTKYGYERLQLPNGQVFVDINPDGVGELIEERAFAEIYPRYEGTVQYVRSMPATGNDGNEFTIYYIGDILPFNPNDYEIAGLVKRITFQSGELMGQTFEVNYNESAQEFEIITQFPEGGAQLPGGILTPAAGDKYVIWNITMPDEYYTLASQEFLEAAIAFAESSIQDSSVYKGSLDYIDIQERGISVRPGRRVRLLSDEYFSKGYYDSRITRMTRRLWYLNEVRIDVSAVRIMGSIVRLQKSITQAETQIAQLSGQMPAIIKSGEKTSPSDSSVYTSAKSEKEFLSKTNGGRVLAPVSFEKGIAGGDDLFIYNAEKRCWIFTGNLLVEKGIAWNSSIEGFDPKTITDAVMIDSSTLGINENGEIYVKGGAGGGGSIEYPLSWSGYSQGMWDGSAFANIDIPSLMSQLTNDVDYVTSDNLPSYGLRTSSSTIGKLYLVRNGVDIDDATLRLPTLLSQFDNDSDFITSDSVNSLLTDYLSKSGGVMNGDVSIPVTRATRDNSIPASGGLDRYGKNYYDAIPELKTFIGTIESSDLGWQHTISVRHRNGYSDGATEGLVFRHSLVNTNDSIHWSHQRGGVWSDDRVLLDSSNYSSYALPITGGAVSGNITANSLSVYGTTLLSYTAGDFPFKDVLNFTWSESTGDGIKLSVPGYHAEDIFLHLTVGGGAVFNSSVTAPKFIGALQGNADSATLWSYNSPWVQDFNALNYSNNGLYHFDGDYANLTGRPPYYSWNYSVLNMGTGSGRRQQVAIPYDICAMFLRVNVNDNWSGWREVSFVDTDSLTPSSGILTVNGNLLATGRIAWNSSRVLKTEIKEHYLSLEDMAQIKPYQYKWKDGRDDLVHAGAIADEVMEIMPETILTDSLGIHSMDYAQTAFVMAASLTPYVSDHERRIKDLETENKALKEEIEKLKRAA